MLASRFASRSPVLRSDYPLPDALARTVSLAENLLREQMHPADQFEAFAALVKEGRPIEDIAADFGVSPLVVQRRLKLANVSPRLLTEHHTEPEGVPEVTSDTNAPKEAAEAVEDHALAA